MPNNELSIDNRDKDEMIRYLEERVKVLQAEIDRLRGQGYQEHEAREDENAYLREYIATEHEPGDKPNEKG